jgi:hypothetical protein
VAQLQDELDAKLPTRGRNVRMLPTLTYVLVILFATAVLFASVNEFEPNRRLALWLKLLVLAVAAAAIARKLLA